MCHNDFVKRYGFICVTDDHRYVPFVVVDNAFPFPRSRCIIDCGLSLFYSSTTSATSGTGTA
jgi:hypothetical protein